MNQDPMLHIRRRAIEDFAAECGMALQDVPRVLGGDTGAFERIWHNEADHPIAFDMVMRLSVIAGLREFEPFFLLRAQERDVSQWITEHCTDIANRQGDLASRYRVELKRRTRTSRDNLLTQESRSTMVAVITGLIAVLLALVPYILYISQFIGLELFQGMLILAVAFGLCAAATLGARRGYRRNIKRCDAILRAY